MHLERGAGRPVGVGSVRPWRLRPTRVGEGNRFWDSGIGKHLTENGHAFGLCGLVVLCLDAIRLFVDKCGKDDVGVW